MPKLEYRELYAPAHFSNSYECVYPYEMKEILREAKFWGFNAYSDWFDSADLKHPDNNPRKEYHLSQAIWDRKQTAFKLATDLGFQTGLLMTPNHVFLDQLRPDLLAETGGDFRFSGQVLCPSKPEGREIILNNYRGMFRDLRERGVHLDSISGCPFDFGGCSCSSCAPYIITFGKLMVDIHEIAKGYFPGIKARLTGWWWNKEDHKLFKEWADREQPGRFVSLSSYIPYQAISPDPDTELPNDCDLYAFVHIGYTDDQQNLSDRYGSWGPLIAPVRLAKTILALEEMGSTGFCAYSEGVHDDANKAILAGISSGAFRDSRSVLKAYAERYFGVDSSASEAWAQWLHQWGDSFNVDLVKARHDFDILSKSAVPGWRLDQWDAKLRIFEANAEVMRLERWNADRNAAAERFFEEQDKCFRSVWKLTLLRHGISPRFFRPVWYEEFDRDGAARYAISESA